MKNKKIERKKKGVGKGKEKKRTTLTFSHQFSDSLNLRTTKFDIIDSHESSKKLYIFSAFHLYSLNGWSK
jgi:hypothetical protein